MPDDLDRDLHDDPFLARVAVARPVVPRSFADALSSRLPVRPRRTRAATTALALASATAALAISVVIAVRSPTDHATHIGTGPKPSLDAAPPTDVPVPPDAPRVDPEARALQLAKALHKGDVDTAVAMLGVPLLHAICAPGRAETAADVRAVATCATTFGMIGKGFVFGSHPEKLSVVTNEIREWFNPRHWDRRHQTPDETKTERLLLDGVTALARDHALVSVEFTTWPPEKRYPGSGKSMDVIFAIDPSGRVDAIILGEIATLD